MKTIATENLHLMEKMRRSPIGHEKIQIVYRKATCLKQMIVTGKTSEKSKPKLKCTPCKETTGNYKWGISDTNLCTFCNNSKETVNHLLYDCVYVEPMWNTLRIVCKEMVNQPVDLSYANVMLNSISQCNAANYLCLVTKQYIYRTRCQKKRPSTQTLKNELYSARRIEKYYAIRDCRMTGFMKRWNTFFSQQDK